ncbi:MAG: transcription antitermination protein NusB [Synergistaceae bacterium]|nr:transcription antitermination protein NusB [Synergistaceae bacterium]
MPGNKKKFIGRKFEALHRSREMALQFLCSLEICPDQDFSQSLELFMSLDVNQDDTHEVKERCRTLCAEVWNRKSEIDGILLRVVTGWRPDRMVSVDRTILRMMILEGFLLKSLPVGAAITEAGTLAGDFGTKDSPRFVKGIMYKASKYFAASDTGHEGSE